MADQRRQNMTNAPMARPGERPPEELPRLDAVPTPRRLSWTAPAALATALCYGAVQSYWASGHAPSFGKLGTDLLVFPKWGAVALCAAAAVLAQALRTVSRQSTALLVAGWAVSGALLICCPFLLLDVVGSLIPGLRIPFDLTAFLSRTACVSVAALLGAATLSCQRRLWGDCPRCSRTGEPVPPNPFAPPPRWAWWAAYGAVASCWLRIMAQYGLGFGSPGPLTSPQAASLAVFETGFVLAGTVLPLSLVHRWGRTFPRWVPLLAGRRVPRLLPLAPATGISVGLLVYFGVGICQLVGETIHPVPHADSIPLSFLWVAMPAYWLWGLGLGAAALSYHHATRRPCRHCNR
ncbi:hypothetical protein [Streptomyces aureus]